MKRITLLSFWVFFLAAKHCQGGVYGSLEKGLKGPESFSGFRLSLGELRGTEADDKTIPVEPGSLRADYLALRERLEKLPAPTPGEQMELAVARMRLGQPMRLWLN